MIQLLISKVTDVYIRENFRRIQQSLRDFDTRIGTSTGSGSSTTINSSSSSIWKTFNNTVPGSTTKVIDTISVNDFTTLKYILKIKDATANKTKSMEMVINNEGGTLTETVYSRIGIGIDVSIDPVNASGIMQLTVVNSGLNSLAFSMARLSL